MDIENNYDGYELLITKPHVKVYRKDDPDHPSIPFLWIELQTFKVFPDQIFNLFSDVHICDQKNWNYQVKSTEIIDIGTTDFIIHA